MCDFSAPPLRSPWFPPRQTTDRLRFVGPLPKGKVENRFMHAFHLLYLVPNFVAETPCSISARLSTRRSLTSTSSSSATRFSRRSSTKPCTRSSRRTTRLSILRGVRRRTRSVWHSGCSGCQRRRPTLGVSERITTRSSSGRWLPRTVSMPGTMLMSLLRREPVQHASWAASGAWWPTLPRPTTTRLST